MIRSAPIRRSDSQAQLILDMIEKGKLNIGDKLPGQRELSEKLNIGRSTLREALRHLEALGVLETRLGLGTYVVRTSPHSFETHLNSWLQENRDQVIKIFEVREALESKSAELAAANASKENIQAMEVVLAEMREAVEQHDLEKITRLDYEFHNLIGISTKNDLLYQILFNVSDSLRDTREAILAMPDRATHSLEEHTAVLNAIKSRSPARAKEMMVKHLTNAVSDIHSK